MPTGQYYSVDEVIHAYHTPSLGTVLTAVVDGGRFNCPCLDKDLPHVIGGCHLKGDLERSKDHENMHVFVLTRYKFI